MRKSGDNEGWILRYHPAVSGRDIPALDSVGAKRIKKAIEAKLKTDPLYFGAPLRGVKIQLFKIRVGDWRVVYKIAPPYVDILLIAHRKDAYTRLRRRFDV